MHYKRKMEMEIRQQQSKNMPTETETYKLLHNIKERRTFHKIQENYWQTMQSIEKHFENNLTPKELELVNQQILSEFSTEELKSALGLN